MNKYYAIYNKERFIGYTDNKKFLKLFLKNRKGKYNVKIFEEDEIPESILNSFTFHSYLLTFFQGYHLTYELPVFEYEYIELENHIRDDLAILYNALENLLKLIDFIKVDNKQNMREKINHIIVQIAEVISSDHEVVYDELVDVVKYFNKNFIDNDTFNVFENI